VSISRELGETSLKVEKDRDERKKNTKGNTKGNPPKIPLAMQSVVEEKDPASS